MSCFLKRVLFCFHPLKRCLKLSCCLQVHFRRCFSNNFWTLAIKALLDSMHITQVAGYISMGEGTDGQIVRDSHRGPRSQDKMSAEEGESKKKALGRAKREEGNKCIILTSQVVTVLSARHKLIPTLWWPYKLNTTFCTVSKREMNASHPQRWYAFDCALLLPKNMAGSVVVLWQSFWNWIISLPPLGITEQLLLIVHPIWLLTTASDHPPSLPSSAFHLLHCLFKIVTDLPPGFKLFSSIFGCNRLFWVLSTQIWVLSPFVLVLFVSHLKL